MKNKNLLIILLSVSLLLMIPLVAMSLTTEVNWTLGDFIIAAVLLMSSGLTIDYIIKKVKRPIFRIVLSLTMLIVLILIWMELSVGIFGTPLSGN